MLNPGVEFNATLLAKTLSCSRMVAEAPSCHTFLSCFGGTLWSFGRCQTKQRCEGTKIVSASGESLDCAVAAGTGCLEAQSSPRACCASTSCAKGCQGSISTFCQTVDPDPGASVRVTSQVDCGLVGLSCVDGECRSPGPGCDGPIRPTCNGALATYCWGGGQGHVDCRTNPFRSACDTSSGVPCGPEGVECKPQGFVDYCEGDRLILCLNGYKKTFDCRTLGFDGCRAGEPHARCG